MAVRLDPFQNIVNVGWGLQNFLIITFMNTGSSEFSPSATNIDGLAVFTKSPTEQEDEIYAGDKVRTGDTEMTSRSWYPLVDDPEVRETLIARVAANSYINGPDEEFLFGAEYVIFFINVRLLFSQFLDQLIEEGDEDLPAALRWGIHYGDDEVGAPEDNTTMIRIEWFNTEIDQIDFIPETFSTTFAELVSQRFADAGLGNNEDGDIDITDLQTLTQFPATPLFVHSQAIPTTRVPQAFDLIWDYAQKANIVSYPPIGARPELEGV